VSFCRVLSYYYSIFTYDFCAAFMCKFCVSLICNLFSINVFCFHIILGLNFVLILFSVLLYFVLYIVARELDRSQKILLDGGKIIGRVEVQQEWGQNQDKTEDDRHLRYWRWWYQNVSCSVTVSLTLSLFCQLLCWYMYGANCCWVDHLCLYLHIRL